MALEPLATAADLAARGIDISDGAAVAALLASASAAVRDAAGSSIARLTSTVHLTTEASRRIELPSRPVHAVSSVTLDGVALVAGTDYVLRGGSLWRLDRPWHAVGDVPGDLVVTFEHGFTEVPADLIDLVCSLVGAGLASVADGFAASTGKQYESIDDYRVGYATGDEAVASIMELPERTRRSLRRRFGSGGAQMVGSSR